MSDDPIMAALAEVEVDGEQHDDPGAGIEEIGEEPDARPEGPLPDDGDGDDGGFSVLSWAQSVPEGSHTDFDATDWWDPENGGENRLAFHLADATGAGAGYPNGLGVLVSLVEMYWAAAEKANGSVGDDVGDDQEADAPEGETVPVETAEALT